MIRLKLKTIGLLVAALILFAVLGIPALSGFRRNRDFVVDYKHTSSEKEPIVLVRTGQNTGVLDSSDLDIHYQSKTIKIGEQKVVVEISDTPTKRTLGLSGRAELAAGTGMLFVFEKPAPAGFWMKAMKFAIDIIWIDESGRVVFIKKDATPESYPEVFTPTAPAKFVLEVPAGFSQKNKIEVGSRVENL